MAGDSNIIYWLQSRNIEASPELVAEIRNTAKATNRVLENAEVMVVVDRWQRAQAS